MALTDQTLDLEDIETNSNSHSRQFQSSIRPEADKCCSKMLEKIEWYWKLWVLPWAYRVGAVLLGVLSVVIVWCEVTFGIYINNTVWLSVLAAIVHELHDLYGNYIAVEALSICIIAYLSVCAYFTVFRIRIFNLYNIFPHHSTDEYSLLFSAMLFTRLALPICLNYLYMIQVVQLEQHGNDTSTPNTAFAYATGNTDLIPWLTNYFYIYYPMLILLICLATLASLGTRLASLLGYQKFIGEDDFSADYIDEGKTLMKRERRIRERYLRDKNKNRDQLPFELLRESNSTNRGRGIGQFSQRRAERDRPSSSSRQTPLHEADESRFGKFLGRVKGAASRGKDSLSAKYQKTKVAFAKRSHKEDDGVELLGSGGGSGSSGGERSNGIRGSGRGLRGVGQREPPKDIFEDV